MKDLKKIKLIHETPNHFIMHDGNSHFHVAKKGLDQEMVQKIQGFADGGEAEEEDQRITPRPQMEKNIVLSSAQHYSGGTDDAEEKSPLQKSVDKSFKVPIKGKPAPETQDEQFARIRRENLQRTAGTRSPYMSDDEHYGKFDGGEIDPYSNYAKKASAQSLPSDEEQKKKQDALRKAFNFDQGGQVGFDADFAEKFKKGSGFSEGGTVNLSEEDISPNAIHVKRRHNIDDSAQILGEQTGNMVPSPANWRDQDVNKNEYEFAEGGEVNEEDGRITPNSMREIEGRITPASLEELARKDGYRKYASGGEVRGMPGHNIDPKEMEEETKHLNTPEEYPKEWHNKLGSMTNFQNKPVQRFDVGGTAGGLPPDFDNRVEAEKQNLAVNQIAMPPENIDNNNIVPATAQPLNTNQFQTQAETNVAAQDQNQISSGNDFIQQDMAKTAQAVQNENARIQADNQIRAQSGLQQLPMQSMPQAGGPSQPAPANTVPKENQVSFGQGQQKSSPGAPQQDLVKQYDRNIKNIQGDIRQNAALESGKMAENATNIQNNLDEQKQRYQDFQVEDQKLKERYDKLYNDVKDSKIDPNRIWANSSTAGKISAALGLIFSGIGSGMSGQTNLAADFLQKTIANDIDAQKNDQSNKMNLYKMGLEQYRDHQSAYNFSALNANAALAGQIQATAQRIGSAQALAAAKLAQDTLVKDSFDRRNELVLKQVALNYGQQGQPGQQSSAPASGINTGKMNAFINAGLYDKDTRDKLIKEQGDYEKLKNSLDLADSKLSKAMKNATATSRFLPHWAPTFRDESKKYESAVDSFLVDLTKTTAGRVTPQDTEMLRHTMPAYGDKKNGGEVFKSKLSDVKDLIRSKFDFPMLKDKGLLNQNDPYITSTGNTEAKFKQGPPVLKK